MTAANSQKRDNALPPHYRGYPLIGALPIIGDDMPQRLLELHQQLGDTITLQFGPMRMFSLRSPEAVGSVLLAERGVWQKTGSPAYAALSTLLGQGLVTAEGPLWLKHRRLVQPAFHRERVMGLFDIMQRCSKDTHDRLAQAAGTGVEVNIAAEILLLTQRIIGLTMLSVDLHGSGNALALALDAGVHEVEQRMKQFVPLPMWMPTPHNRRLRQTRATLDRFILDVIHTRRAERSRDVAARGDLLDMLMDAKDADTGASLNDDELRDEVLTIFMAGHETTANLLSFTMVALSDHPAIDAELHQHLNDNANNIMASGTLLEAVLNESMRLMPPVWTVDRVAQQATTLDGFAVHPGDGVLISPWLLHRNERLWPEPQRFDPTRFLTPAPERHKFAFLPFIAGNRKCIGDAFAMLEAKVALQELLKDLRFTVSRPVKTEIAVTLRPKGGVFVRVHRREA